MKRIVSAIIALVIASLATLAAAAPVEPPDDCHYCGMNRTKFAQSRMLITHADGSSVGTCSINCAGVDKSANRDKKVATYQVGDFTTKKLIDAQTAVWVIGGKKRGVMTSVAKWAFADPKAAAAFVKENGGKTATFAEAMAATEKELAAEQKRESRKGHSGHTH
jgi:nitrous oxide reductase accessory protein NosL